MSEPLSTNDIEDVVSSVRRLVSPEARPRTLSRDLGMDRLILTPSLRIVAEHMPSGPTIVKLEAVTTKSRTAARKTKPVKTPAAAKISEMATSSEASPESLGQAWSQPVASLAEMALQAEEAELITTDAVQDDPVTLAPPVPKKRTAKSVKADASKDASGSKARTSKAAKKVDVTEPKAALEAPKTPLTKAVKAKVEKAAAEKSAKSTPAKVVAAKVETIAEPVSAKPKTARKGRPSVVETKVSVVDVSGEPTEAARLFPESVASDVTTALPDVEVAPKPVETPVISEVTPGLTDLEGNAISLLDEDELMQILRRVIREELQGVLGEKITRNVRKLVRAEIARAFTAQTLD